MKETVLVYIQEMRVRHIFNEHVQDTGKRCETFTCCWWRGLKPFIMDILCCICGSIWLNCCRGLPAQTDICYIKVKTGENTCLVVVKSPSIIKTFILL